METGFSLPSPSVLFCASLRPLNNTLGRIGKNYGFVGTDYVLTKAIVRHDRDFTFDEGLSFMGCARVVRISCFCLLKIRCKKETEKQDTKIVRFCCHRGRNDSMPWNFYPICLISPNIVKPPFFDTTRVVGTHTSHVFTSG